MWSGSTRSFICTAAVLSTFLLSKTKTAWILGYVLVTHVPLNTCNGPSGSNVSDTLYSPESSASASCCVFCFTRNSLFISLTSGISFNVTAGKIYLLTMKLYLNLTLNFNLYSAKLEQQSPGTDLVMQTNQIIISNQTTKHLATVGRKKKTPF